MRHKGRRLSRLLGEQFFPASHAAERFFHFCQRRGDITVAASAPTAPSPAGGVILPGKPPPPSGSFTSVSAGRYHSCGVRADGSLACWGSDSARQATPPSGSFTSVSAGGHHSCGVRTDGSLACWGSWRMIRSDGTSLYAAQNTPPEGTFDSVSAGGFHGCGVRTDGSLACWGAASDEDGLYRGQDFPPNGAFRSVSAGGYHNCGVRADGTFACWGDNSEGQSTP